MPAVLSSLSLWDAPYSANSCHLWYVDDPLSYVHSIILTSLIVNLSSTVSNSSRHTVCPDETVFYYCTTNADSLFWVFPTTSTSMQMRSYWQSDPPTVGEIIGPITVWKDDNQLVVESHARLLYSPLLNNSEIICGRGSDNRHGLPYKLAGIWNL